MTSLITPINTITETPVETPSTIPSAPIEQNYSLEARYWVDDNGNKKQESSEKDTPRSTIIIIFDNGDKKSYTMNKQSFSLPKLESRIKNIIVEPTQGYSFPSTMINDIDKYLDQYTYKLDIRLEPILGGTIVREKTANGQDYTITYTIINTGSHGLEVKDSLLACKKTIQLPPQAQISCELQSSYFVRNKPLKINNTITLLYKDNIVKKETIKTVIDEKSPEIQVKEQPSQPQYSPNESSPSPQSKMTNQEKITKPQVESIPGSNHKPHHPMIAMIAFIILIGSIAGIAFIIVKKRKE